MDLSDLPEPMRARLAREAAQSPTETVREFIQGFFSDAFDVDEVRRELQSIAESNTRAHRRYLTALDAVLADPPADDTLVRIIQFDAGWELDDPSNAGAIAFLREQADMLRAVIERAPHSN